MKLGGGGILSVRQDVVFKGVKDGLYITLNDTQELDVLKEKLKERLLQAECFFQSSDVILDVGTRQLSIDEVLDIQHILASPSGLRLKKLVHGDYQAPVVKDKIRKGIPEPAAVLPKVPETRPLSHPDSGVQETLLHRGTLRSGQRIDHHGNVVVIGDVNPGAEIRATGDIAVMGALRGLAHAGANGDIDVSVIAFRLAPTQLRIADIIGRPPENSDSSAKEPEVARLKDGMIIVEALEGTRWEGER